MKDHNASLLLLLLLSGDLIFTIIHILRHTLFQTSILWSTQITTYLLAYLLVKLVLVNVMFISILRKTRCSGYISWLLVFTYLLLDDALNIHQIIGRAIFDWFNAHNFQNFTLPARFFELAVLGIIGMILVVIVTWAFIHNDSTFRKITKDLLVFIIALFFFGIIVDLASLIRLRVSILRVLDFIEDGGELIVYSLILWYLFLIIVHTGEPGKFFQALIRKRKIIEPS